MRTQSRLLEFTDRLQGLYKQQLDQEVGEYILFRSDGLIADHLAVVVDDKMQGITEIVRGCNLLESTPRQIYLQEILDYPIPGYIHLPLAIDTQGEKISKQNLAK